MLTLGACKGVGSRLLPVGLENVCTEVDPISALSTAAVAEKIRSFTVAFSKQDVLLGGKCYSSFFFHPISNTKSLAHFQHEVTGLSLRAKVFLFPHPYLYQAFKLFVNHTVCFIYH